MFLITQIIQITLITVYVIFFASKVESNLFPVIGVFPLKISAEMKIFVLLFFCSSCAFAAFSQNRASFGFVVKAGNFSLPFQHKENTDNELRIKRDFSRQTAGYLFGLGIWESYQIDAHFKLYGELVFRHSSCTTSDGYDMELKAVEGAKSSSNREIRFSESNLSLPVKLHYSFASNGRTAVAIGAGIVANIGTTIKGTRRYRNSLVNQNAYTYSNISPPFFSGRTINPVLTLITGVYHRIQEGTSIGLEFAYERRSAERRYSATRIDCGGPLIDCGGYSYLGSPSMRSLSIVLSHDLPGH